MKGSISARILALIIWLALPPVASAQFDYVITNQAVTITRYTGPYGAVIIPSTTNGLPVVSIGAHAFDQAHAVTVTVPDSVTNIGAFAFYDSGTLTSITIGSGVTSIGDQALNACPGLAAITVNPANPVYSSVNGVLFDKAATTLVQFLPPTTGSYVIPGNVVRIGAYAFSGCGGLASVTIPNSVTNIGCLAFSGCYKMKSITIPASVISIGAGPFSFCFGLGEITVDSANPAFCSTNGVLFDKSLTTLIQCLVGKAGSYALPDSVTSIGAYAFAGCSGLTNVTFPDGVATIADQAFSTCSGLTSLTIPGSVTSIGDQAFFDCFSLTSIAIPGSVTSIGAGPFAGSYRLGAIMVDPANPAYCSVNGVLYDKSLTTLIQCPAGFGGSCAIPASVTSIGDWAFLGCTALAGVTIPNGVTGIGTEAFHFCSGLTSVTIPDSVTSIGSEAFYSCTSLTSVSIGTNVTSIGDAAFAECGALAGVTIPNSLTRIGNGVFYDCSSLAGVTIGTNVTSIGDWAFGSCFGLSNLALPDSVTSIGASAFQTDYGLTNITIGRSLAGIGASAFQACRGLTSLTLPASVSAIGDRAFGLCYRLASVYFQGDAPSLGLYAFGDGETIYYLPGTLGWGATFGGCPTAPWVRPTPVILNFGPSFGAGTNGFGFLVSWATNIPVVVEASASLDGPDWSPVVTNALSGGSSFFSDPLWTNHPARFYRVRSQ